MTMEINDFDRFMAVSHFDDEMAEAHTPTEDAIHNWIVDHQEDDELIAGILKHLDRTIEGAIGYCIMKAFKSDYINGRGCGRGAMIDNATGFSWVKEYFTAEKVETKPVLGKMTTGIKKSTKQPTNQPTKKPTKKPKKKKTTKKTPEKDEKQLDLFSDLSIEEGEF